MNERFSELLSEMSVVEMVENVAIILLLIVGLIAFCRSSSGFSKYFIPAVCAVAAALRIVHWAYYGDEPAFMTPLVSVVAGWIS
jgi:hypothetical protein